MEGKYTKHVGKSNVSANLVSRADVRALFTGRLVRECRAAEADAGGHAPGKGSQESPCKLELEEKRQPERNSLGNCRSFFCSFFFLFLSFQILTLLLYFRSTLSLPGRQDAVPRKQKILCWCPKLNAHVLQLMTQVK